MTTGGCKPRGSSGAVDTLVRSVAVDLFRSCCVALAPISVPTPPAELEVPELVASIDFAAPLFQGTLYLCCPRSLLDYVHRGVEARPSDSDWVRELANQLLGRIKKNLLKSNVSLKTHLPKPGNAELARRRMAKQLSARVYEFRTLTGPVVVILDGTIDDTVVSYSGGAGNVAEGDIIIFDGGKS